VTIDSRFRRAARRLSLTAAGLTCAATITTTAAAPAPAEPLDEFIAVTGQILQTLPLDQLPSELPTDIPSLLRLLTPQGPDGQQQQVGDRTRCTTAIHIGDSTSVGIDDAGAFGDSADRLSEQYRRVGVTTTVLDASGGRSIVEKVNGQPNAVDAITAQRAAGHRGCWVIAMGVNDAANIGVGSTVGADERIDRVMAQLKDQDVLWPTVATSGATVRGYSSENMEAFNGALRRAAVRYPNLKVYDFAAEAAPAWFADGIHYTSTGKSQRNRLFATALATAYPA